MFEFTRSIDGPFRRGLDRQVKALVGDRFAQTNCELQTLTDYDLQLLGYSVAGSRDIAAQAVHKPANRNLAFFS